MNNDVKKLTELYENVVNPKFDDVAPLDVLLKRYETMKNNLSMERANAGVNDLIKYFTTSMGQRVGKGKESVFNDIANNIYAIYQDRTIPANEKMVKIADIMIETSKRTQSAAAILQNIVKLFAKYQAI